MTSLSAQSMPAPLATAGTRRSVRLRSLRETLVMAALIGCGMFSILTTVTIIGVLLSESLTFFAMTTPVLERVTVETAAGSSEEKPLSLVVSEASGVVVARLPADFGTLDFTTVPEFAVGHLLEYIDAGGDKISALITGVEPDRLLLGSDALSFDGPIPVIVAEDAVTFREFITGTQWNPLLGEQKNFGIWPLICGTMLVTVIAMVLALPLGLITAIWLSEYAPDRLRRIIKPVLEVLAGIPTVVFGFFALTFITPALRFEWLQVPSEIDPNLTRAWNPLDFGTYNALSAGIAVGILCLPIVTSLAEDALRAVPKSLREGAYGLGGTRFEVSVRVVVPAALSGIIAAFLLAIARAVGETMVVALAAGASPTMTADPRDEIQPMTGYMVQIFLGDASNFGPEYLSSYAVAATLFVMTFALTLIGHQVRVRFRQEYE